MKFNKLEITQNEQEMSQKIIDKYTVCEKNMPCLKIRMIYVQQLIWLNLVTHELYASTS